MTEKLYIDNPYLKETHAQIVEKNIKDETFLIKLDRTIFFPHMDGAQPKDLGTIDGKQVIDTYKEGNDIVHVLEEDINSDNVSLMIDWSHRFDLMQQHTGQHLLSASFKKLFNAETVGFHLGQNHSTIDIELETISKEEIIQIETLTNKIVQSNFKVRSYFLNSEDIDDSEILDAPATDQGIRRVNIYNVSADNCCGTHVSSTGEVGLIRILNADNYKGNIRVTFLCGNRALEDYRLKDTLLKNISLTLSTNISDTLERFYKLLEDKDTLEKYNKNLREELLDIKAERLLEKKKTMAGKDYIIEDLKKISKEDLNLLSSNLNNRENLIQIYKFSDENYDSFLICKSKDLDIDLKEVFNLINEKNIIKGGGSINQVQGSTSADLIDKVVERFFIEIQKHFKS